MALGYLFWHAPAGGSDRSGYEGTLTAWHEALAAHGRDALVMYFCTGHYRQPVAYDDERLAEAGVKFHDVGDKRGPDWIELTSVVEGYPLANRYHPAAQ